MTHPLEQLAEAVDGTLSSAERAALEDHLRSCASCRDEIAVAAAARNDLKAMPAPAAPDLAARFTPDRIAALSTSPTTPQSPQSPQSPRSAWSKVAPALAAAAVVALIALVVPRLGSSPNDENLAAGGPEALEVATEGPVRLQLDETDYDTSAVQGFATALTASLTAGAADAAGPAEVGAEATSAGAPNGARFAPGRTRMAVACLRKAFPDFPGEIVQVREAAFEGEPAFLGVVLETPEAGMPPEFLSIWVAAIDDCSVLSVASDRV